jgi:farnesyl diphosphate synthase
VDFAIWMTAIQARTEAALERFLPTAAHAPQRLHAAMRYVVLGGGKRIRPLLCHAAGEIFGADAAALDIPACAVELIHAYSLTHDDLPCMDDDVLRRGKPSCHIEYDEATALLAGDALQTLAFQLLAEHGAPLPIIAQLARAAGSRGMAGGQAIDLAVVGQELGIEALEFMHIHKTGALLRAAVLMGAQMGSAHDTVLTRLNHFAGRIGLLFQVVDDILDAQMSTAVLGKTAGKDAARCKPTYVTLLGLAEARRKAAELHAEAQAALMPLSDAAQRLRELTDYIADRTF